MDTISAFLYVLFGMVVGLPLWIMTLLLVDIFRSRRVYRIRVIDGECARIEQREAERP